MNQLVIDLDSLSPQRAQRIAQMVLAYAGTVEGGVAAPAAMHSREEREAFYTASARISKGETESLERVTLTPDQVAAVDETAGIPDSGHIAPGYGPVTAKQYEEFVTTGTIVGLDVKYPEQLQPAAPVAEPVGRLDPARVSPPPVPAPSTAAAAPLPTAPAEQQAGAPAAPSVPRPPVPAAPTPPVPTAPVSTGSPAPAVDSRGLPWDERIHSSSKATNADGSWRARRNMTDEQKAAVPGIEAELRARIGGKPVIAVPAGAGATAIIIDPSAGQSVSAAPLPPVPPVPAPTAPAPDGGTDASDSAAPANAVELVTRVTALGTLLAPEELQAACATVGLPDSPQAMLHLFAAAEKDPTLVGRLWAEIQAVMAS